MGLRPLAGWDCGFESRRVHGGLYLVTVVCCLVEVCASGWLLLQRSPNECGVSECDREASTMWRPWTNGGCRAIKNVNFYIVRNRVIRKEHLRVGYILCQRIQGNGLWNLIANQKGFVCWQVRFSFFPVYVCQKLLFIVWKLIWKQKMK